MSPPPDSVVGGCKRYGYRKEKGSVHTKCSETHKEASVSSEKEEKKREKSPERREKAREMGGGSGERDSVTGRVKDHERKGHRHTERDTNSDGW